MASRQRCRDLKQLPSPKSARQLLDVLGESTVEIRRGDMDSRTALALAALCNAAYRIVEGVVLEDRLAAVERRQDEQDGRLAHEYRREA